MLRELLLPTTDRLVLIEVVVVLVACGFGLWSLRAQREWQLVLTGVALVVLGGFALRAVH